MSIYEFYLAKVLILGVSTKKVLFLYRFIMSLKHLYTLLFSVVLIACAEKKERVATPWGTTLGEDTVAATANFALQDIPSQDLKVTMTIAVGEWVRNIFFAKSLRKIWGCLYVLRCAET